MAGTTRRKAAKAAGDGGTGTLRGEHCPGGRWVIFLSDDGSLPGQSYIPGFGLHGNDRFVPFTEPHDPAASTNFALKFATEADAEAWRLGHLKDFDPFNPVVVNLDTLGA